MEPVFETVWPQSPAGVLAQELAPRLASLKGATIGLFWDEMFRGDELFPVLADALRQLEPTVRIVGHEVFGNTHGHDEAAVVAAIPAQLRDHGVTAVVSAVGC